MTREEWLLLASRGLVTLLPRRETPLPPYTVSVGFPKGSGGKGKRRGQCWGAEASADKGTFHIFISPEVSDPADIMRVLLHELCHVWAGVEAKHRGAFITVAKAVGLVPPWTSSTASEGLEGKLEELRGGVGGWPGVGMVVPPKVKGATRMRLWECPHGQKVRAATDELGAKCLKCGGEFLLQSGGGQK